MVLPFETHKLDEGYLRLRHSLLPLSFYTMNVRRMNKDQAFDSAPHYHYPNEEDAYEGENQYFGSEPAGGPTRGLDPVYHASVRVPW